jgi:hypothetical protein
MPNIERRHHLFIKVVRGSTQFAACSHQQVNGEVVIVAVQVQDVAWPAQTLIIDHLSKSVQLTKCSSMYPGFVLAVRQDATYTIPYARPCLDNLARVA